MLTQYFLPFLDALRLDNAAALFKFQQDNARPHISRITCNWFKTLAETHGLTVIEWLPNSPDMNPIEHIWAHLKYELH
jgi:hypothetical protein